MSMVCGAKGKSYGPKAQKPVGKTGGIDEQLWNHIHVFWKSIMQ